MAIYNIFEVFREHALSLHKGDEEVLSFPTFQNGCVITKLVNLELRRLSKG